MFASCNILPIEMYYSQHKIITDSNTVGTGASSSSSIPEYMSFCWLASHPFSCDIFSLTWPIYFGFTESVQRSRMHITSEQRAALLVDVVAYRL